MKKIYKVLIWIIVAEFLGVSFLNKMNVTFDSLLINVTGAIVFFVPILSLLVLVSRDKEITKKKRVFAICFSCFIIISFVLGVIANLLAN